MVAGHVEILAPIRYLPSRFFYCATSFGLNSVISLLLHFYRHDTAVKGALSLVTARIVRTNDHPPSIS